MISFCIPVFNFEVAELVNSILQQSRVAGIACEIVLIDDASLAVFRQKNAPLAAPGSVRYIQLHQNIGRARIRNLFLEHVQTEYLVFLDCDSKIVASDFVENYYQQATQSAAIVCGGRISGAKPADKQQLLRWRYSTYKEYQTVAARQARPNQSFMTNNFMVQRTVLEAIRFDESLSEYGHEDTLFGYELKKSNITITHIDNPVLHADIETRGEFIAKTERGLCNLSKIVQSGRVEGDFWAEIKLLRLYAVLQQRKILYFLLGLFWPAMWPARFLLLQGCTSLLLFDLYKLLYFHRQMGRK